MAGWVYVIRNPAMPKLVKVGFTELGARRHAHRMTAREGVPDPTTSPFVYSLSTQETWKSGARYCCGKTDTGKSGFAAL
jgi:hypothetical protein